MAISKKVNKKLVGLELEALSLLLHFWAKPKVVEKRKKQWDKKIVKFRKAVIADTGRGKHENHIPRELVHSEYKTILHALRWLKNKCKKDDFRNVQAYLEGILVPYEVKKRKAFFKYERPIPLCSNTAVANLKKLFSGTEDLSRVAHKVVGKRLGCSAQKVKDATWGKKGKRLKLTKLEQLLISVFLDLCSEPEDQVQISVLLGILNRLFAMKTSLLIIYYLVQRAHSVVGKELFIGKYDMEEFEKFCDSACGYSESFSYQPFLRL